MSRAGRRLVSAYLTTRHDGDLLEWVEELAARGSLSHTVKEGLRLLQLVIAHPDMAELHRRGLLIAAVKAGIAEVQPLKRPSPAPSPAASSVVVDVCPEADRASASTQGEARLEASLDRLLDGT